jgi:hypothetical protein
VWLIYAGFVAWFLLYWAIFIVSPAFHMTWMEGEDSIGEWMTFFAFLAAGVVVLRCFRWRRLMTRWTALYLAALAGLLLVCAGEEISWGQRIVGFHTPDFMDDANEQGEFNLHNMGFTNLRPIVIFATFIQLFGIGLPIVLWKWTRHPDHALRRYLSPPWLVPCFLFAELLKPVSRQARGWVADHLGADVSSMMWHETKELVEQFWGFSLCLAALAVYAAWRRHAGKPAP